VPWADIEWADRSSERTWAGWRNLTPDTDDAGGVDFRYAAKEVGAMRTFSETDYRAWKTYDSQLSERP
jgi:hypothetical protein